MLMLFHLFEFSLLSSFDNTVILRHCFSLCLCTVDQLFSSVDKRKVKVLDCVSIVLFSSIEPSFFPVCLLPVKSIFSSYFSETKIEINRFVFLLLFCFFFTIPDTNKSNEWTNKSSENETIYRQSGSGHTIL